MVEARSENDERISPFLVAAGAAFEAFVLTILLFLHSQSAILPPKFDQLSMRSRPRIPIKMATDAILSGEIAYPCRANGRRAICVL